MRRRGFQWLIVLLIVLTRTRVDLQAEMSSTHGKLRELRKLEQTALFLIRDGKDESLSRAFVLSFTR